jgi:CIC family chloride channel protein
VLTGVLTAGTIVRLTFGYSFATWRFHLRGVPVRAAFDVGWIGDLTVRRLMRADAKTVRADETVAALRGRFPPGTSKAVFVVDADDRYLGQMDMPSLYADGIEDEATAGSLVRGTRFLLPEEDVRAALQRLAESEQEALPVLDGPATRKVLGLLTEAYALRRYTQELERVRRDELGAPADGPALGNPGGPAGLIHLPHPRTPDRAQQLGSEWFSPHSSTLCHA